MALTATFVACEKNEISHIINNGSNNESINRIEMDKAKKEFVLILSKAVSKNVDIRVFLKKEALKMIDNDYDVFYPLVKDQVISGDKTFRDVLKDFDLKSMLDDIERALPLLTIYVPNLPSNFSADTWKPILEIPYVISDVCNNDSLSYCLDGREIINLPYFYIPSFPVLVVKNNERIVRKSNNFTRNTNISDLNDEFAFIDESFNGVKSNNGNNIQTKSNIVESNEISSIYNIDHLKIALQEMGLYNGLWQRDNIYYGLTKSITSGSLKRNIRENIAMLRFSKNIYEKISDQKDDPKIFDRLPGRLRDMHWTDGFFELKIDVLINNNKGLGSTITKIININPRDIYELKYKRKWIFFSGIMYVLEDVIPKDYYPNIDLVTWDLESNGMSWKFIFTEVDDQETYTTKQSLTTDYATNFTFNTALGDVIKQGLNFGNSSKTSKQNEFTVTTYKNSDELGTLEIDFQSPVLLGDKSFYSVTNPMISMVLIPKIDY